MRNTATACLASLCLLLACSADAFTPLWLDGFEDIANVCNAACSNAGTACNANGDCSGCSGGCASHGLFALSTVVANSGTITEIAPQNTAQRVHNGTNGGDTESFWSGQVNIASGHTGYWTLPTDLTGVSELALGFNLHALQVPLGASTAREIARIEEDNGAGGKQQGCYVELLGGASNIPTIRGVGTIASGTTTATPGLPTGTAAGDLLIMFAESSNEAVTISSGWTQAPNSPQTVGAGCPASGCTRLTAWYKIAVGSDARVLSGVTNHVLGQILGIQVGTFDQSSPINTSAGSTTSPASTAVSIPGATTTVDNCLIVASASGNLPDANSTTEFSAETNASLANVTERGDNTTNAGDGGALLIATGELASLGTYSATTATAVTSAVRGNLSLAITPQAPPGSGARSLRLRYRGLSTAIGTSTEKMQTSVCCVGSTCDPRSQCRGDSDCAVGSTCGPCASDGSKCYWGGVELHENVTSQTQVTCDLWIDGRLTLASGTVNVTGAGDLKNFRLGAPGTDAVTPLNLFFDDVVLDQSSRAGYGYLGTQHPATQVNAPVPSSDQTWSATSCTTSDPATCLNDWRDGGSYDQGSGNADELSSSASTCRVEKFAYVNGFTTTGFQAAANESISAVAYVAAGSTNSNTGVRQIRGHIRASCGGGTCVDTGAVDQLFTLSSSAVTSPPFLWGEHVFPQAPSVNGLTRWTNANVHQLGVSLQTCAATTCNGSSSAPCTADNAAGSRLAALLFYIRAVKPDAPPQIIGGDHNKGTDDGKYSLVVAGDSTCGATVGKTCSGGSTIPCTWHAYCPNLSVDAFGGNSKDRPVGGCTQDTDCQTCTGRRSDTGNGAGFFCDATTGGTFNCTAGTCSGGFCTLNANVPCSVNGDCSLGTCDNGANAVCTVTCPAGTDCPTAVNWPGYLVGQVGADAITQCCVGGESTPQLVSRFANVLSGASTSCILLQGTGACGCSVNKDCGACATEPTRTCSSNSDCAAGDTCTTGTCGTDSYGRAVCTAGPTVRTACQNPGTDCPTTQPCTFPPPDDIDIHEGYNDGAVLASGPNCDGGDAAALGMMNPGQPCDFCAGLPGADASGTHLCLADSDCSGIAADSKCFGHEVTNGSTYSCLTDYSNFADGTFRSCNTYGTYCPTTFLSCPSGLTCSQNNAGDVYLKGVCQCGTCPTGFTCNNSICRKNCTVGTQTTDCGAGGVCDASALVCKGRCTCPSDARSCTTDADCGGPTPIPSIRSVPRPANGTCNQGTGKCACTGWNPCRRSVCVGGTKKDNVCTVDADCPSSTCGACPNSHTTGWYRDANHTFSAIEYHAMQAVIDGLSETDGRPRLIVNTLPDLNALECAGPDPNYTRKLAPHTKAEFPNVYDAQLVLSRFPSADTHADSVHPNAAGGTDIANGFAQWLGSHSGTCATTDGNGDAIAQRYCRNLDGAWRSCVAGANAGASCQQDSDCPSSTCGNNAACTTALDCLTSQSCQLRPCSCTCASNQECVNWFGDAKAQCRVTFAGPLTCQTFCVTNADCAPGNTCNIFNFCTNNEDSCTRWFGAGYACDLTSGHCLNTGVDACPASGDSCVGLP